MSHALPSLRTVQTIVFNEYQPIEEGAFRFDALLHHLGLYGVDSKNYEYWRRCHLLHLKNRIQQEHRLVGFVLPCNDDGLPIQDALLAVLLNQWKIHLEVVT